MNGKISVKHVDTFGKSYTESGLGINNFEDILDSSTRLTTATQIDNLGRRVVSLSRDTYEDVEVSAVINVTSDTVSVDVGDWNVAGTLQFNCLTFDGAGEKKVNSKLGAKYAGLFNDSTKADFISQVNQFGENLIDLLQDVTFGNAFGETKRSIVEIIAEE